MNKIYQADRPTLFWYSVIILIMIFIFSHLDISLNIVYGTFITIIILYYLFDNYKEKDKINNQIISNKYDLIIPRPKIAGHYVEIVDFLFSIQDFYVFNPVAYGEMVEHLDKFFLCYNEITYNRSLAGTNYNIMLDEKRMSINTLQSIVIAFSTNRQYMEKFNTSLVVLEQLLNTYLDKAEYSYKEEIYYRGYNNETELLLKPPFARNMYDDEIDRFRGNLVYTYDFV